MMKSKLGSSVERWQKRVRPIAAKAALSGPAERRSPSALLERPRTVGEAAEELGLSVHTIRAWIAARRLAHVRLGRAIRVPAAEIRRVLERSAVSAVEE
jgi:excisionase family DNA binding protein